MADLRWALDQPGDADALYEQAADILDGLWVHSDGLRSKTTLIAARSDIYVDHFRLAINALADPTKPFASSSEPAAEPWPTFFEPQPTSGSRVASCGPVRACGQPPERLLGFEVLVE